MKRWPTCTFFVVLLFGLAGCGKSKHEALADDLLALEDEALGSLEYVTDDASAQAAAINLKKLEVRLKELEQRAKTVGKPAPEEETRLKERMSIQRASWRFRLLRSHCMKYEHHFRDCTYIIAHIENMDFSSNKVHVCPPPFTLQLNP